MMAVSHTHCCQKNEKTETEIQKFCMVLTWHYMFCMDLGTDSNYLHIKTHKDQLIGFYNQG